MTKYAIFNKKGKVFHWTTDPDTAAFFESGGYEITAFHFEDIPVKNPCEIKSQKWIIISEMVGIGSFPYLSLISQDEGEAKVFKSKHEAIKWASENCAWDFKVIPWD